MNRVKQIDKQIETKRDGERKSWSEKKEHFNMMVKSRVNRHKIKRGWKVKAYTQDEQI